MLSGQGGQRVAASAAQDGPGRSIGRVAGNAPGRPWTRGSLRAGNEDRASLRDSGLHLPVLVRDRGHLRDPLRARVPAVRGRIPADLRYVVAAAFVVLLYASVLVHELSHSVVARAFGLPVRRILLYPLGGYSEIEREPPTPGREFLVSAAGPALSLALAARSASALDRVFHPGGVAGRPAQPARRGEPAGRDLQPAAGPAAGRRPDAAGRGVEADRPRRVRHRGGGLGRPGAGRRRPAAPPRAVPAVRQPGPGVRRALARGHRRVHVDRRDPVAARLTGAGAAAQPCRRGCSPGGPSRSRPACRWPRRSGGPTPPRRAPWWWWTTRTGRSPS